MAISPNLPDEHITAAATALPLASAPENSIIPLVERLRSEDKGTVDDAAAELFERYFDQLRQAAAKKLARKWQSQITETDMVRTTVRQFCADVAGGNLSGLVVQNRSHLWRLLSQRLQNKVTDQVRYVKANKRMPKGPDGKPRPVAGEEVFTAAGNESPGLGGIATDYLGRSAPVPGEEEELTREISALIDLIKKEDARRIAQLHLQGQSEGEIARTMNVSTKTVQRKLDDVGKLWCEHLGLDPEQFRLRPTKRG